MTWHVAWSYYCTINVVLFPLCLDPLQVVWGNPFTSNHSIVKMPSAKAFCRVPPAECMQIKWPWKVYTTSTFSSGLQDLLDMELLSAIKCKKLYSSATHFHKTSPCCRSSQLQISCPWSWTKMGWNRSWTANVEGAAEGQGVQTGVGEQRPRELAALIRQLACYMYLRSCVNTIADFPVKL